MNTLKIKEIQKYAPIAVNYEGVKFIRMCVGLLFEVWNEVLTGVTNIEWNFVPV